MKITSKLELFTGCAFGEVDVAKDKSVPAFS